MAGLTRRAFMMLAALAMAPAAGGVSSVCAKEKVKIAFVGPLTGPLSPHGIGGRNSAEVAVKLMNADPQGKYEYELVVLDDECKPNIGVQVITKIASDRSIIAAILHYCSATAIATVDVFHRFKLQMVVWAAVLPEITYAQSYPERLLLGSGVVRPGPGSCAASIWWASKSGSSGSREELSSWQHPT